MNFLESNCSCLKPSLSALRSPLNFVVPECSHIYKIIYSRIENKHQMPEAEPRSQNDMPQSFCVRRVRTGDRVARPEARGGSQTHPSENEEMCTLKMQCGARRNSGNGLPMRGRNWKIANPAHGATRRSRHPLSLPRIERLAPRAPF